MADAYLLENGTDRILLEDGSGVLLTQTNNYSMTADVATFSVTPTTTGLKKASFIYPTAATYSVTPTVTGLRRGAKLAATVSSFALTPRTTGLAVTRKITGTVGSYSITPQTTGLRKASKMTALEPLNTPTDLSANVSGVDIVLAWQQSTGFVILPQSVIFARGLHMSVTSNSYALTVQDVGLFKQPPAMPAEGPLTAPRNFSSLLGASNVSVTLSWERGLGFEITPADAGLVAGRKIAAATASYTLTPYNVTLTKASGHQLSADTASITLTPASAGLRTSRRLNADSDSFTLSPLPVVFRHQAVLTAIASSFAVDPNATALVIGHSMTGTPAVYTLTANAAGFQVLRRLVASSATFVLTGRNAGLSYSAFVAPLIPPLTIALDSGESFIELDPHTTYIVLADPQTYIDLEN